jgi:hypothetical protein
MNTTLIYTLIAGGLVAIALLATLILRQLQRERARKAEQAAQEEQWLQQFEARQAYLSESIRLVAGAILHDEKMTATEGCIRLKVLLENFRPHLLQEEPLRVISRIHDQTSHIPIKDEWQALPKKLKREYRQEMEQLENSHLDAIQGAARALSSGQYLS